MGVSLYGVQKSYGVKPVLQDFSLSLPATGTVALLGPSGCGKTTLLRLLAGLEKADGGEIVLPRDTRLSMVFQEDRLLDSLDILGNILVVLDGHGEAQKQRARDALARCGLEACAHQYPPQLSGGMRRRVAVARALAYGGSLLLLDEPFKGLDPQTKGMVAHFVFEPTIASRRLTLLVTHDREEAMLFADTILELDGPPLRTTRQFAP